jgi:hypothetical protein
MEPVVKSVRWLSKDDAFGDVAGRNVYSSGHQYIGRILGEDRDHWFLDAGDLRLAKKASPGYYLSP